MLMELLEKREEDDIPQGSHGIRIRENKDAAWESLTESCETVGMKAKNQEGRHLKVRLIDAIRRIQKEHLEKDFGTKDVSPLSVEILAESFPDKFKLPSLDKYDGKTDSYSHLANFGTTMLLQNVNDIILCRVFPSALTGLAQK